MRIVDGRKRISKLSVLQMGSLRISSDQIRHPFCLLLCPTQVSFAMSVRLLCDHASPPGARH
jgi:hypothetical protein